MSEISCHHCTKHYDDELDFCPYCRAPSPAQQQRELANKKNSYLWMFIALVIFCGVMIAWLPRIIHS
jgi:hypothetical protein